ncbi:MAG: DedA family protein [Spirochaetaceae bacterium]|jgi:membrane protein DedA with SNARE-associated domain|nr:DedA family protein [Spirochaetaceae bacterium]
MKKIILIALLLKISFSVFAQTADSVSAEKKQTVIEKVALWYMDNINYFTITLLMTVESSFIPFPSEVVVPPAAYKASRPESGLNIIFVVIFATIGAIAGSTINYFLALFLGRAVIYKLAESKFGRMCLLSTEKVKKAENYFLKYGKISTFIGRLVPVIRQLISIPAGLAKMPFLPFVLLTTLGALIWNIILAFIGYIAHGQAALIDRYGREISYVMLALCGVFILYLIYNGFIKKNNKPATGA